jgi:diguanylate cyclase (GGDEF)-like protein
MKLSDKRTVLVVEDNQMNREMLCELLKDEYNVLEAVDGLDGLEQLKNHYKDLSLILLDVIMPNCDGFEFLKRKKENPEWETVPVIVMTASDSVTDEIRCLELGATDFVMKPYDIDIVKNRMLSVIRLRESAAMLNMLEKDSLTGLYSKEFFYRYVETTLAQNPDKDYDIICSDIENFKMVNERYTAQKGDLLLKFVAEQVPTILPGYVMGGRLNADNFAYLTEHTGDEEWKSRIHALMEKAPVPNAVVKFGVVERIDREQPVFAICDRGLLAMDTIKKHYGHYVAVYDDDVRQHLLKEQQIMDSMETALEEHQFVAYFQPKRDLHTDRTGGAEALVRWIHPEFGFMSPGLFIPIFEKTGFITRLDFFIMEEACKAIRKWKDNGMKVVPISINVSRMDFYDPDLAERIIELADRYEVDHELLHIEVTESAYMENSQRIIDTIRKLQKHGFLVELDDFGSGYSSLTTLKTMSPDVMKIDMSIVQQDDPKDDGSVLVFSMLLANRMNMKTVAEGVETKDQVERLKSLGCDNIQGFYYSKPLPQKDFEQYLLEEEQR